VAEGNITLRVEVEVVEMAPACACPARWFNGARVHRADCPVVERAIARASSPLARWRRALQGMKE
jgi:hypothetical protein